MSNISYTPDQIPMHKPKLIIVIPCYNEEETLPVSYPLFMEELNNLLNSDMISSESHILFVDDGSSDKTWDMIRGFASSSSNVRGIRQSRNRGHQNALWAGLMEARSLGCDVTVTIDCDGQADIHAISSMLMEYSKGVDVVYGVRTDRATDTFFKRTTAEGFYHLQAAMGVEIIYNHADYRLLSSRVLDTLFQYKEVNLYLRGLIPLIGYRSAQVGYARKERLAGNGHFGFFKMLSFACDGITSLTIRPIYFVLASGILLTALGLLALLGLAFWGTNEWKVFFTPSIVILIGGLNLIGLGIIGEYVGKAYLETKARPHAVISERTWE